MTAGPFTSAVQARRDIGGAGRFMALGVAVLLLAGCAWGPYEPGPNETAFLAEVEQGDGESAIVNFDTLIPGEWTRLVIVCHGSTKQELLDALGFAWDEAPNPSASAFGSMIVFAGERSVITQLGPQEDEDGGHAVNWTPCTPTDVGGEAGHPPLVIPREASSFAWVFNDTRYVNPSWYVPIDETQRLEQIAAAPVEQH